MKLSQLFSIYSQLKWGETASNDVSSLCADSRKIETGCVFVAIKGYSVDGHNFIEEAVDKGAIGLVVQDESLVPERYKGALVQVEDTREALDRLASRYYGNPADHLFCVGVTGTNGKTSVAYFVEKLLKHFQWDTGVLGTVDHHLNHHVWESQLTTPDAITLHKRLNEFRVLGAQAVCFEVSSHALVQKRVDGIPFDVAVFTNLTRDHLDYHKTMGEYFLAKERLFSDVLWSSKSKKSLAVINNDDEYGKKIRVAESAQVWTYGKSDADFTYTDVEDSFSGTSFYLTTPRASGRVFLPVIGEHNVANAVAAIAVAMFAGASLETCIQALESFSGAPGRLERVRAVKDRFVFVDYAHTDDALRNVLSSLASVRDSQKEKVDIITVFGCGGDRDKGKRSLMMKTAEKFSDKIFLTSDNPRTEDPRQILDDALEGASDSLKSSDKLVVEVDRKKSIERALIEGKPGDVILIAGKGHEDYQIIGTEKLPFSDFKVVEEFSSEL